MGEESGTECRSDHRSGIGHHGDDRKPTLRLLPDKEVPHHRHGKRHTGAGTCALDKACKQKEVQRARGSTGKASESEERQTEKQHGASAVSVGERSICDWAEGEASHEEAERELC